MKIAYLRQYFPAIPSLPIRLGYPEESLSLGPLDAILDTGADGTLIPQVLLDELGAPLVDQIWVRSQWGESRQAGLYTIDLSISDIRLPAIEVVGVPGSEIILGRDVLNRLRLLLDGLAGETKNADAGAAQCLGALVGIDRFTLAIPAGNRVGVAIQVRLPAAWE